MEKLRNDPYPYCHLYKVLIGYSAGRDWQQYVLHCDYPRPSDKRNTDELKRRLSWTLSRIHIYSIKVLKKDYIYGTHQFKVH